MQALWTAIQTYREHKDSWARVMERGMLVHIPHYLSYLTIPHTSPPLHTPAGAVDGDPDVQGAQGLVGAGDGEGNAAGHVVEQGSRATAEALRARPSLLDFPPRACPKPSLISHQFDPFTLALHPIALRTWRLLPPPMATTAVSDLSRRAALSTALRTQSGSRQHLPSFPGPPHAAHTLRRHHAIVSFRRSSLAGIARVTISRSYPSRTAASRSVSRPFPPAIRAFTNQPDAARPGSKASRIAATDAAPSLLDTSRRQAAAAARSPAAVAATASAAASTTAAAAAALEDSLSSRGIPEAYSTDAQILSGEVEGFAGMNEEGEWILLLPTGRKRQYPRKRRSKPRVPLAIDPVDRVDAVDSVDAPRNAASNVRLPSDVSQIEESTPLVFKRKVEDCYALSLVRTQKSMDKCKEDLQAQIVQCGGKPVRTEYPLAGGASKPSKSARPSAKK
ncbi:unnamed protein product [Closterium sp. NIES-53]